MNTNFCYSSLPYYYRQHDRTTYDPIGFYTYIINDKVVVRTYVSIGKKDILSELHTINSFGYLFDFWYRS